MSSELISQKQYDDFCDTVDHYPNYISNAKTLFFATGFAGEAGEVANKVKKIYRDDGGALTDERREMIIKELGGAYWYFSRLCAAMGTTPQDIMRRNYDELYSRRERGVIKGDGDNR